MTDEELFKLNECVSSEEFFIGLCRSNQICESCIIFKTCIKSNEYDRISDFYIDKIDCECKLIVSIQSLREKCLAIAKFCIAEEYRKRIIKDIIS